MLKWHPRFVLSLELLVHWISATDFTSAICASCFSRYVRMLPVNCSDPFPDSVLNPARASFCATAAPTAVSSTLTFTTLEDGGSQLFPSGVEPMLAHW